MEPELEKRWRAGLPPFDGVTVHLPNDIPLLDLISPVAKVIEGLHEHSGTMPLIVFDDWHEHDGFVNESKPATWEELISLAVSEETLLRASTGESYVSRAYCPVDRGWLLRLLVPDRYDNSHYAHNDPRLIHFGAFDVTCEELLAHRLHASAQAVCSSPLLMTSAKAFFDQRYGG
jgi:hypothetical protein